MPTSSFIRLYQYPSKASPVPADIVYLDDSANAFDEVQSTIAQFIGAYPNLLGIGNVTLTSSTFPFMNSSAAIVAGTLSPGANITITPTLSGYTIAAAGGGGVGGGSLLGTAGNGGNGGPGFIIVQWW